MTPRTGYAPTPVTPQLHALERAPRPSRAAAWDPTLMDIAADIAIPAHAAGDEPILHVRRFAATTVSQQGHFALGTMEGGV